MMYCIYKKNGIRISQVWFSKNVEGDMKAIEGDILFFHALDSVEESYKAKMRMQHTAITDLTLSEEELRAQINKTSRYKIKRAEREGVLYNLFNAKDFISNDSLYEAYVQTYNQMHLAKGMKERLNQKMLKAYIDSNMICFSVASLKNNPIVFHSYIYDDKNVRLYQSASCFRNIKEAANFIGMMNKGLHWFDIIRFKTMGVNFYDWGGISNLDNPNGIDKFKLEFGGTLVTKYNVFVPKTIKGNIACRIKKL